MGEILGYLHPTFLNSRVRFSLKNQYNKIIEVLSVECSIVSIVAETFYGSLPKLSGGLINEVGDVEVTTIVLCEHSFAFYLQRDINCSVCYCGAF
jgi:hypothetical protein